MVLGLTAVLVTRLLGTVPVGRQAAVGVPAAVGLAVALALVGGQRRSASRTLLASLLAVPIAAGAGVAFVWTLSALVVASFPVAGPALARPILVDIGATVLVVGGCLLAVFGAAAATAGAVDTARVGRYAGVVARTALPVTVVAAVALVIPVAGVLSADGSPSLVGVVAGPLLTPTPGRTHLGVFLSLVAVTAWLGSRAVGALPLAELASATPEGPDIRAALGRTRQGLGALALLALLAALAAGLIELLAGQSAISETVPALYDLAVAVSGSPALRLALWWTTLAALAVVLAVWLLRRTVRRAPGRVGLVLAPYVGGVGLTAAALVAGGPVVSSGAALVRAEAPAFLAGAVDALVSAPIEFYGPRTVAVGLTAASLLALVGVTGALWTVLFVGYVGDRGSEAALAGAGLFVATGAAGTLSASPALVLGGSSPPSSSGTPARSGRRSAANSGRPSAPVGPNCSTSAGPSPSGASVPVSPRRSPGVPVARCRSRQGPRSPRSSSVSWPSWRWSPPSGSQGSTAGTSTRPSTSRTTAAGSVPRTSASAVRTSR
ncbi:hypothetical protein ACFQL1_08145 [Halomicroarcula sp. GCM10025709]